MTVKEKQKYALVAALFLIGVGGLTLHYFVHPPQKADYGYVPMASGILSAAVVPWLFLSRRTLNLGYLLNGFTVILGLVTMGHFALTRRPIWPDHAILASKLFVGYVLYNQQVFNPEAAPKLGLNAIRYPHLGFWLVHLVGFSTVYALGALVWR